MKQTAKPVDTLKVEDLQLHPVWRFTNDERDGDETMVRPVKKIPVASLSNTPVGTQVVFANGQRAWALIGNVDETSARNTEHFLHLSVERHGRWFRLARYFDRDYAKRGPRDLARFLGLSTAEVFPITYDIRPFARGDAAALAGQVREEPRERLSRAEIIAMAVPRRGAP